MGNSADGSRNGVRANGTRAQRNPDKLAPGCVRLLEEAGFTYDRQIGAWLNIPAGRVIAFDRVANRSPECSHVERQGAKDWRIPGCQRCGLAGW